MLLYCFCSANINTQIYTYFSHLSFAFVIDFWTTKCTNCPDALDKLNNLAKDERYKNVKFASICCGTGTSSDESRNIIEKEDSPRWDKVSHFFMDLESKEEAKKILGFKQVPFYVVLNDEGEIVQMGSKKYIDFDNLPGMEQPEEVVTSEEKKDDNNDGEGFAILDLDF